MPFKKVDAALQDYAAFLRDKVAAADAAGRRRRRRPPPDRARARAEVRSVPDLAEIIALPQDEMRDIVARFMAATGRRARRGGGRGGGQRPCRDAGVLHATGSRR